MNLLDCNNPKEKFMVTGCDTGVGKTLFVGLLGKYISLIGLRPKLIKPFCSGGRGDLIFLETANGENSSVNVNYWYHEQPISPAAWELLTGNKINFANIIKRLRDEFKRDDFDILLVEGVGGLLAPVTLNHTIASLTKELGANLIIIAPNRVGVINHVLMTVEAAISRGLSVVSVVLMGQEVADATAVDNAELIRMHIPNMSGFKGVFEFPWLGRGVSNPDLITVNVKKADSVLEKIFDEVFKPYFINVLRN